MFLIVSSDFVHVCVLVMVPFTSAKSCHTYSQAVLNLNLHSLPAIIDCLKDLDETSKRKIDILDHFVVSLTCVDTCYLFN